jgi:hypothetical protein
MQIGKNCFLRQFFPIRYKTTYAFYFPGIGVRGFPLSVALDLVMIVKQEYNTGLFAEPTYLVGVKPGIVDKKTNISVRRFIFRYIDVIVRPIHHKWDKYCEIIIELYSL